MFWYCNFWPNREDKWDNFFYIFFWWSISWVEVLVYKFEYFLYDTKKRKDPNWLSDNYPIQFRTALLGYIYSAQRSKCKKRLDEYIFIIIQFIYTRDGVIKKRCFRNEKSQRARGICTVFMSSKNDHQSCKKDCFYANLAVIFFKQISILDFKPFKLYD